MSVNNNVPAQLEQKKVFLPIPGMPAVLLLQMLESIKIRLPVSSENLKGLLKREDMGETCSESVITSGIKIRNGIESIKDLI